MKVTNYKIYDMAEAIIASGFPMLSKYDDKKYTKDVKCLDELLNTQMIFGGNLIKDCPHCQRAIKLASAKDGSGHRTFLSGILVAMNITATIKWWVQWGRYHFQQIDSSMSTMHRLRLMQEKGCIKFHPKTDKNMIKSFQELVASGVDDETIAYSCPSGLELTARVNTNYLELRTMYVQRKGHKLMEWRDFCQFIEELPFAQQLITGAIK